MQAVESCPVLFPLHTYIVQVCNIYRESSSLQSIIYQLKSLRLWNICHQFVRVRELKWIRLKRIRRAVVYGSLHFNINLAHSQASYRVTTAALVVIPLHLMHAVWTSKIEKKLLVLVSECSALRSSVRFHFEHLLESSYLDTISVFVKAADQMDSIVAVKLTKRTTKYQSVLVYIPTE